MNALEQGGRAVNSFIDSLKRQPLALALVVMNVALLAFLFWNARDIANARNNYLRETQQILASCIHVDQLETIMRAARGGNR